MLDDVRNFPTGHDWVGLFIVVEDELLVWIVKSGYVLRDSVLHMRGPTSPQCERIFLVFIHVGIGCVGLMSQKRKEKEKRSLLENIYLWTNAI